MHEILFHGRAFEKGIWYEGDLIHASDKPNNPCIILDYLKGVRVQIIPETVGQYTGQPDKNNKKIFEGDIVKAFLHNETPFIFPITFRAGCFWFGNWNWCEFLDHFRNVEVIGNIYDNPELLNVGKSAGKEAAQIGLAPATENFELMEC